MPLLLIELQMLALDLSLELVGAVPMLVQLAFLKMALHQARTFVEAAVLVVGVDPDSKASQRIMREEEL